MLAHVLALAMIQTQQRHETSALYLFNTCQSAIRMLEASKPDPRDFLGGNYCIAYVEGFVDGSGTVSRGACLPSSVDAEDVLRTYVAYLTRHPEEKPRDRRIALIEALADAYPCLAKK